MISNICILLNTIHFIIPPERWEDAWAANGAALPATPGKLRDEFVRLSCSTGLPVILETFADGRPRIVFCTERLEVACNLTKKEDAYQLAFINPLSVRRRNMLARQVVLLVTRNPVPWNIHKDAGEIGRTANLQSGYKEISTIWNQISTPEKTTGGSDLLSPAHYKFLSDVENLVDIAHEVELDSQNKESVTILKIEPVATERYARDVYKFQVQSHHFKVGDYVLVGEGAPGEKGVGYTGSVIEALPTALVLSFRNQPDARLFRDLHWIKPFNSNKQFEIQKSALRALRDGSSANPHLLNVIVDGQFATSAKPPVIMDSVPEFNESQRTAIGFADTVPDLMLVIGPPGTGKTKCISEMARRHTRLGKRVLITSKNNKAVDNVLEKLQGMETLRIGSEEKVSAEVQPLMIDAKARELQQQIITSTTPRLAALDRVVQLWSKIEIALDDLERSSVTWQEAAQESELQRRELTQWASDVYASEYRPSLDRLARIIAQQDKEISSLQSKIISLTRRKDSFASYTKLPLLGIFLKRSVAKYEVQIDDLKAKRSLVVRKRMEIEKQQERIRTSYKNWISESTEALARKNKLDAAAAIQSEAEKAAFRYLYHLNKIFSNLGHLPLAEPVTSPQEIPAFAQCARAWHKQICARQELLRDWHDLLSSRHQSLYPSLVRSAEVVGATCIGIATDARFESLDFDIVIADEAGQIQVTDLLVPLVRAKRAVLVGDDQQLPPIVEEGIVTRLDPENPEQQEWAEKSLFELIHDHPSIPANRNIMLSTQYRIPQVIADMISAEFYENRYKTGHDRPHSDPLFDRPLVFIDTAETPNRRDSQGTGGDGAEAGYTNNFEADLIASLVLTYQKYECPWGVIVPYKRQSELIRQKLKHQIAEDALKDWVATVDSFQGKERDVIIYGFTRSNKSGRIGFLSELRRLNVSLTRASSQLIVVGDSAFLTSTVDPEFSNLVRNLLEIAKSPKGAYYNAGQIRQLLASR